MRPQHYPGHPAPPIYVQTLGRLVVWCRADEVAWHRTSAGTGQIKRMFSLLITRAGAPVVTMDLAEAASKQPRLGRRPRDQDLAVQPPKAAVRAFRQFLKDRDQINLEAVLIDDGTTLTLRQDRRYWCRDVDLLTDWWQGATMALTENLLPSALAQLQLGAQLCNGHYLPDCELPDDLYTAYLLPSRSHWEILQYQVLLQLARLCLTLPGPQGAMQAHHYACQAVQFDPDNPEAWQVARLAARKHAPADEPIN